MAAVYLVPDSLGNPTVVTNNVAPAGDVDAKPIWTMNKTLILIGATVVIWYVLKKFSK